MRLLHMRELRVTADDLRGSTGLGHGIGSPKVIALPRTSA